MLRQETPPSDTSSTEVPCKAIVETRGKIPGHTEEEKSHLCTRRARELLTKKLGHFFTVLKIKSTDLCGANKIGFTDMCFANQDKQKVTYSTLSVSVVSICRNAMQIKLPFSFLPQFVTCQNKLAFPFPRF